MIVKYCIKQIVFVYICVCASFDYRCPHISHWNLRAGQFCNTTTQYYCLLDVNTVQYNEFCRPKPDFETSGYRIVLYGGLNGKLCTSDRYQPFLFWTNGSSDCTFQKSLCSEEGHTIEKDYLSGKDNTCRCDYTRGYSFVLQPKHTTYCVPSEEDCSCYTKLCVDGMMLNADYHCVTGSLTDNDSSNPNMPSKNKSSEIEFLRVNIKQGQIRILNRIPLLSSLVITALIINSILLVNFCIVNSKRGPNKHFDQIKKTPAYVYEETTSEQTVLKEQEMHLENVKGESEQNSLIQSTKAFTMIYEAVEKNAVTIISGPPGCGKTSMCYQAAYKLRETYNYTIVVVSNPVKLIKYPKSNTKLIFLIDDIVGQYSINESSLKKWERHADSIKNVLNKISNTKLIVTCRSYMYRNERFRLSEKLPHIHCDMLAEEMMFTNGERRLICRRFISEEELMQLRDDMIMLYNFFPLICKQYKDLGKKNKHDYFLHPNDIIENEMNELRLSSDPCFIALGLLVIYNNSIDRHSLKVHDHKQTTKRNITDILNDMQRDTDFRTLVSSKGVLSSLTLLDKIYVKETCSTFTSINKSMFDMLVGTVGPHFIPCILKYSNSELIKKYFELLQFTTDRNPHTIKIESQYEKMYYSRIIEDIKNGFNWDVFNSVQMKSKEYRSYFLENVLKTETPIFCKSRKDGSTPLHVTSFLGYNDLSFFFVESDKSQVNSRTNTGKTPLHVACSKGNTAVAKSLIKYNAIVNQLDINKVTPFMLACSSGHTKLITFLLTKEVHINAFNSFRSTPLLEACIKNNVKACSLLLENNAKVDCFNKNGNTPLHLACQAGQSEILIQLLKYDIDTCINRPNVKGYTPFYLAIRNGHNEIANTIIKHGADPNYQNEDGSTPLHIACETNKFEIVKILLEQYQVEFNKEDNKGRTPLDISKINKRKDISELIIGREQIDKTQVSIPITSTSTC